MPSTLRKKMHESNVAMVADAAAPAEGREPVDPDPVRSRALASAAVRTKFNMPMPSEPMHKQNSSAILGDEADQTDVNVIRARKALVEVGAQIEGLTEQLRESAEKPPPHTANELRVRHTLKKFIKTQERVRGSKTHMRNQNSQSATVRRCYQRKQGGNGGQGEGRD